MTMLYVDSDCFKKCRRPSAWTGALLCERSICCVDTTSGRKEKEFYLEKVEQAKKFKGIEEKNAKVCVRPWGASVCL